MSFPDATQQAIFMLRGRCDFTRLQPSEADCWLLNAALHLEGRTPKSRIGEQWCAAWAPPEDKALRKALRVVEAQLRDMRRYVERLHLCADHRDKAVDRCIVCQAEDRTRAEMIDHYADLRDTLRKSAGASIRK
jgi:hypothetical protein